MEYGVVCAVVKASSANTGNVTPDPWPGSRVISAQKANTANAFSNVNSSISTAWLFPTVQDGNALYGLQFSNPVDPRVAYRGDPLAYGTANDPVNGLKSGGVNVFGGGEVIGAIGVSGDISCADHNVAWRTRSGLGKAFHAGLGKAGNFEQITYGKGGHPECGVKGKAVAATIGSSTN
ncbi:MAG: heme-binding protein [Proteobacteria bacterium]|nr:heme-binding protein [Pseudomonadota bacterium]